MNESLLVGFSRDNVAFTLERTHHISYSWGVNSRLHTNHQRFGYHHSPSFLYLWNVRDSAFHFYPLVRSHNRVWIVGPLQKFAESRFFVRVCAQLQIGQRKYGPASTKRRLWNLQSRLEFNSSLEGADNEMDTTFTGVLLFYIGIGTQICFVFVLNFVFVCNHMKRSETLYQWRLNWTRW